MGGVLIADVVFPSENNKLKKLGKYFTKGLQAGVLAAALMAGTVGCSNAAGGNTTDNGGGINGGGTHTANICGLEHDFKHPAYMNVKGDFGGQRFVESDADWFYDGQNDRNTKFTNHYNDANQYIDCKVAELNKLWQEKNTDSTLSNQIGTALSNLNNKTTISQNIDNNYSVLAPVFATMENSLKKNSNKDYYSFGVSYWKLAADAYNQSLGAYATEENKKTFTTNSEMKEGNNFFNDVLPDAGLSYQSATNSQQATKRMNDYLSTIAYNTNTNVTVLKKVVELALYNESLYGLNDYANRVNVHNNLQSTQRSLSFFIDEIELIPVANTQNLDDRTM